MKSRIIKGISSRQHQPVAARAPREAIKRVEEAMARERGRISYVEEDHYLSTPGHIMQPPIVDPATGRDITAVTIARPDGSLGVLHMERGAFEQLSDLVRRMELVPSAANEVAATLRDMPRTQQALRDAVRRASRASELYQRMSGRSLRSLRYDRAEEAVEEGISRAREAIENMTRLSLPAPQPPRRPRIRTCQGCIYNRGTQGDQTFCGEKSRCVENIRCPSYRTNTPPSSARRKQR